MKAHKNPTKAKRPFLLCRKHIGMDLTETSGFTEETSKCIFCKREHSREYFRLNYAKSNKWREAKQSGIVHQVEMTNQDVKSKEIIPWAKEEILLKRQKRHQAYTKKYTEDATDGYVKTRIMGGSNLEAEDIPDKFVEVYRELLKFKRAIRKKQ